VRWPEIREYIIEDGAPSTEELEALGFANLYTTIFSRFVKREINQIQRLVENIRKSPQGRRHLLSSWNPATVDESALHPCHVLYQFYVSNDGRLSCQMYQRSVDVAAGLPFNIASTALLTHMLAQQCDLQVGKVKWVGGDTHIYSNHVKAIREQINRPIIHVRPQLRLNKAPSIFEYRYEDFAIIDYLPQPAIKYELNVG
jgi:thymidylate synthase